MIVHSASGTSSSNGLPLPLFQRSKLSSTMALLLIWVECCAVIAYSNIPMGECRSERFRLRQCYSSKSISSMLCIFRKRLSRGGRRLYRSLPFRSATVMLPAIARRSKSPSPLLRVCADSSERRWRREKLFLIPDRTTRIQRLHYWSMCRSLRTYPSLRRMQPS